MIEETHFIATPHGRLGVAVVSPSRTERSPVVVMFHDGPGFRDAFWANARRIAINGYCVVVPDRYHRHGDFWSMEPSLMRTDPEHPDVLAFRKIFGSTGDAEVKADVAALLTWLPTLKSAAPGKMGTIGYCIGSRSVLRTMADHPDKFAAGVCFHPSFMVTESDDSPHLSVAGLPGELFVGIGDKDQLQSIATNQKFLDAVKAAGGQVDIVEGADHGYAVPGFAYHDSGADRGYRTAMDLFARTL